jgi:drug/metabolite transporter (DMT)-like permease
MRQVLIFLSTSKMHQRKISEDRTRLERLSRNSTGVKEAEFAGPRDDIEEVPERLSAAKQQEKDRMLMIIFGIMVFVGLGNKIFNKLMTIPMHNYANFLNLMTTFMYVPVTFAYIIPAIKKGWIPIEQTQLPKTPFCVMGALDSLAGIMQVFAVTYLPGPLVILLTQAAIPINMVLCKLILKAEYNRFQYVGALIVAGGIATVLVPSITGGGDITWAIVLILSCVPMTLSSVYKEIALGETELDPMYLNGWIAVFQCSFAFLLCVPASLVSEPPVAIEDLPQNMLNGAKCFVGISSQTCEAGDDECTADNCFPNAPLFVTIYLVFNQLYNLFILLLIKYGSSNLLWMALTLMVPLGNVAFTLPFVPEHQALEPTDIIGLVLICLGLGCYRFAAGLYEEYYGDGLTGPQRLMSAHDLRDDKEILNPFLADQEGQQRRSTSAHNQMSLQSVPEDDGGNTDEL